MDFIELFDKTKAAFANQQSIGNRYRYPAVLKQDAAFLLKHYPMQVLSQAFGISTQSLRNWQGDHHASQKSTKFVPLKLDDESCAFSLLRPDSITLKLADNVELIVSMQSMKDAAQFIAYLMKEYS
jgi:hypothetical protein